MSPAVWGILAGVAVALVGIAAVAVWWRKRRRVESLIDTAVELARAQEKRAEEQAEAKVAATTAAAERGLQGAHAQAEDEVNDDGNLARYLRDRGAGS